MKYIGIIVTVTLLVVGSRIAQRIWGFDRGLYFLGALVVLYVILHICTGVAERRLIRDLAHLDQDQRDDLCAADPDFDSLLSPPPRPPWYWRALDALLGIALAFVPPLLVSLIRGDELSWHSEFTGFHLLAMCCGVSLYVWLHTRLQSRLNRNHEPSKVA